jgi:hypothetical protein
MVLFTISSRIVIHKYGVVVEPVYKNRPQNINAKSKRRMAAHEVTKNP